jgi:chemotaxis response regulator CheB
VKVLLVANASPVRERLAGAISEILDIQLEIREPEGEEVARTITKVHPDVVLVDVDQTHGQGLEIIRQIHARRSECDPVIMAMASSSSLQYRASCLKAGAMYFFDRVREQDWLMDSLASIREQLG